PATGRAQRRAAGPQRSRDLLAATGDVAAVLAQFWLERHAAATRVADPRVRRHASTGADVFRGRHVRLPIGHAHVRADGRGRRPGPASRIRRLAWSGPTDGFSYARCRARDALRGPGLVDARRVGTCVAGVG